MNTKPTIKHSDMVARLVKPGHEILIGMSADDAHLWHMVTGVAGESGELVDAIKKHVIYRKPLDRANVVEELGDLEFYMEGIRQVCGITRKEVLDANVAKLSVRYEGLKYTDEQAQSRADKK